MVNEDTENALKVAAGDDQEPIEALSASGADEAFGDRVGLRRAYRCLDTSMPSLAKMASKARLNSLSRSRLRKTQRRRTLSDCPSELAALWGDPRRRDNTPILSAT
jgi:hypothetical protein